MGSGNSYIRISKCRRDLVARGKRSAPAEAARRGARVWLFAIGRRSAAFRGCLKRSLNSRFRYHALRDVHEAESMDFVARRKRQRTRDGGPARKQRVALPGLSDVASG